MRINFDFADLEAFLAVKDTLSFHAAAERLNLSQSAVTRRIRKLEQALDSVLFERTTREVRPTLAAKRLQARAQAILDDAAETGRALRDESVAFAHQRNLVVTVAIVPTLISEVLVPAIRAYRAAGQGARIRLLDTAANEVSEAVAAGDADFGIGATPGLAPELSFETLFEDRMVLVLAKEHPLAATQSLTWEHLQDQNLILPARKTGNRVLIDDALAGSGEAISWTYETERSTTALTLAASGLGVAILPLSSLGAAPAPALTWRRLTSPEIARPVGLLTRRGQRDSADVKVLQQAVRASCRDEARSYPSPD